MIKERNQKNLYLYRNQKLDIEFYIRITEEEIIFSLS